MKVVVVGGGAAGFFAALKAKQLCPSAEVVILEKSAQLLTKVRISGGGRCNVTHGCFDPKKLVENYPRGKKELLGPFYKFQPLDTIKWFKERNVTLKQEEDGRIFPVTNSSLSIINCLVEEAKKLGILIRAKTKVKQVNKSKNNFRLLLNNDEVISSDRIILASGSSHVGFKFASLLGHTIKTPVASLFTFNIDNFLLSSLAGSSIDQVKLKIADSKFESEGPVLITHWGFSGPATLRLSAFAARYLAEKKYHAKLIIDWIPNLSYETLLQQVENECRLYPHKLLFNMNRFNLPKKLWKALIDRFNLSGNLLLNNFSKKAKIIFCQNLKNDSFQILNKTTFKEEFVTCGGVTLSEVNFKTMESKLCKGIFFCGEILDIDGITGGFNFQNAWTTGWLAGMSVIKD